MGVLLVCPKAADPMAGWHLGDIHDAGKGFLPMRSFMKLVSMADASAYLMMSLAATSGNISYLGITSHIIFVF